MFLLHELMKENTVGYEAVVCTTIKWNSIFLLKYHKSFYTCWAVQKSLFAFRHNMHVEVTEVAYVKIVYAIFRIVYRELSAVEARLISLLF